MNKQSFMEMIYIASDHQARHTNLRLALGTNAATWAEFQRYRRFDVGSERATFLIDYYNVKGDLADTILIDNGGFTAITGQRPKAEADYDKIDDDYWAEARKARVPA